MFPFVEVSVGYKSKITNVNQMLEVLVQTHTHTPETFKNTNIYNKV